MNILKRSEFVRHAIVFPFIWSLFLPLIVLDLLIEIYHRISFPLYGFACVDRASYILIIDRAKLQYLTWYQKLNCMYCGYGNGVIGYWARIAGLTESYWCGIQHDKNKKFKPQSHQKDFAKFGDETEFRKKS